MNNQMKRRSLLALGAAGLAGAMPTWAQDRPLTLIVPYPAGGPADTTARQMTQVLRRVLERNIVIENIAGASGAIGIQRLLSGPADGQQFMMGTPSDVILAPLGLRAVKHKPEQLRLVGMALRSPLVLVTRPDLPATSLGELLSSARKTGAKELSYGSIGIGSLYHLVAEDFAVQARIRMVHVPYKGVAPLIQDLIGGQVDLAFLPTVGNLADLIQQGKLHALAVAADKRTQRFPDVFTVAEAAGLKGFDYEIWGGLFVPKATPGDVVARLNHAINEALRDPEFRRQSEAAGSIVAAPLTPTDADRYLDAQTARYTRIAQSIKLEPQ